MWYREGVWGRGSVCVCVCVCVWGGGGGGGGGHIKAASLPVVIFLDKRSYFTNRNFDEIKSNVLLSIAAFVVLLDLKSFIKTFYFRLGSQFP